MSGDCIGEVPERIYLQLCDDSMSDWFNEITWSGNRVHDKDVEYVRADVVERLRAELAAINGQKPVGIVDGGYNDWIHEIPIGSKLYALPVADKDAEDAARYRFCRANRMWLKAQPLPLLMSEWEQMIDDGMAAMKGERE